MFNTPRILLILKGILIGLFLASLFPVTAIDIVFVFVAILIVYYLLTLPAAPDGWFSIGGVVIGILIVVLGTAALSLAALGGVTPALVVIALLILIVK